MSARRALAMTVGAIPAEMRNSSASAFVRPSESQCVDARSHLETAKPRVAESNDEGIGVPASKVNGVLPVRCSNGADP
jgi:hypothetical protein